MTFSASVDTKLRWLDNTSSQRCLEDNSFQMELVDIFNISFVIENTLHLPNYFSVKSKTLSFCSSRFLSHFAPLPVNVAKNVAM